MYTIFQLHTNRNNIGALTKKSKITHANASNFTIFKVNLTFQIKKHVSKRNTYDKYKNE